jgi:DUF3089 family protein
MSLRIRVLFSALLVVGVLGAIAVASASASTVWLCQPGLANSPCSPNLTTAVNTADNAPGTTNVVHIKADPNAKADCFYVYPTVSDQKTTQANLDIDPEERSIVLYQADYYSRYCRVYAPMYRQFTLGAANAAMMPAASGPAAPPTNPATAFADVDNAFLDYLHHDNHGRPIIFIGHSQGSGELEQLLAKEVDPKPAVRKLMLSAIILGGNVTVANGSQEGGTFKNIPACRSVTQLGCVVAFSSFESVPTSATFFGRTSNPGQHVLCTNPANLAGGSHVLDSVFPTAPFAPGTTIAAATALLGLPAFATATPWVEFTNAYSGACQVTADNDNYLQITPIAPSVMIHELTPALGLHLVDSQLGLGNLVSMVHSELGVWAKKHPAPKPRSKHHH